jgi:DNA-binding protein YbaB
MIRSLLLDPAVFQDRDADLLSDLVLGAVAEAQRRASEALQQAVTRLPSLPPTSPL